MSSFSCGNADPTSGGHAGLIKPKSRYQCLETHWRWEGKPASHSRAFRFQMLFPSRNWPSRFSGLSGLSGHCIRRSSLGGSVGGWLGWKASSQMITSEQGILREGVQPWYKEPRSFQRGCTGEVLTQRALISSCKPADSASASVLNVFQTLRLKTLKVPSWTFKV